MTDTLKIAIAQTNPTVGDIDGNARRITEARMQAHDADLVIFSELVLCGYPPEDLVLKPAFQDRITEVIGELARSTSDGGPAMIVGAPWKIDGKLYNAALLLDDGEIVAVRQKWDLPNYGVFDEKRVFANGPMPGPVNFRDVRLGVMICEDMWKPDVTECLEESGAEILVVLNGSPFDEQKHEQRIQLAVARVTESGLPLMYVHQVGGQDELVFDGASFVIGSDCRPSIQMPSFTEAVTMTEWTRGAEGWSCTAQPLSPVPSGFEAMYSAMMLGLRDYVNKNGFPGVILGLSGGIDSALSAAVAVDALGADRVHCVMMPSPYTSADSLEDAAKVAELLGTKLDSISIEPAMKAYGEMLAPSFEGTQSGIAEENIQSRSRGLLLMALSNKHGSMLLTTGNKSEMSVGYATLYGDMCGGYSVLKDVYKTDVFALSEWRNAHCPPGALGPDGPAMPERVITKPPSAELKPDQTDQDSLPPYDVLDGILEALVEREESVEDCIRAGYEETTVRRIWRMLDRAEYKRRQAPPGVKVTTRNFGRDRRYPITNGFTRHI
jgi:NAD+ synthase